ncbi:MAG: hypothetical protein WDW38_001551 [Sanguina aurantia]
MLADGFVKEDGFGSREGRQGRFIKDDAKKYPVKDDLGWFLGATGGWAGGETALKSMIAEENKKVKAPIPEAPAPIKYAGDDVIYMGYDKGDDGLKVRKSGAKGRIILDDASRYPQKEDLGGLLGATGGFAGGEVGLKSFAATGELRLRKPNEYGAKKQFNPLGLAAILVVGGAGGGVALDLAFNAGSSLVNAKLLSTPIDDNTKTLLLAAVGLVAVSGLLLAGRAAVISMQEKLNNSVRNVAVTGAFGVLVVLVAIAVLEN